MIQWQEEIANVKKDCLYGGAGGQEGQIMTLPKVVYLLSINIIGQQKRLTDTLEKEY